MVGDLAFVPTRYGSESMDKVYGSSLLPVIGNDDTLNFRLFPYAHMDSNPQELYRHIRPLVLIYRKSEWCEGVPINPAALPLHQGHDTLCPEDAQGLAEDQ